MLTRLTFDGGYVNGDDTATCSCKACTAWQNVRLDTPNCKTKVSAITVNWEKFTDLFKVRTHSTPHNIGVKLGLMLFVAQILDQDNSGELDFRKAIPI